MKRKQQERLQHTYNFLIFFQRNGAISKSAILDAESSQFDDAMIELYKIEQCEHEYFSLHIDQNGTSSIYTHQYMYILHVLY